MRLRDLREQVLEVGMVLYKAGLVGACDGNPSARDPTTNLIAIKPSGFAYRKMRVEDVTIIDVDGNIIDGENEPSSEMPMHTYIYRNRSDIHGVVHCHAPHAIAWSVVDKPIPSVTVGQVIAGGSIPISEYKQPGTLELGKSALADMGQGFAVVLQNHGIICIGHDLEFALDVALAVEDAARVAMCALQIGGKMRLITNQEYADMMGG